MANSADEEWYSPKRPSHTVAVNSSEINTKMSVFFDGILQAYYTTCIHCFD